MRTSFCLVLGAWIIVAAPAFAQSPAPPVISGPLGSPNLNGPLPPAPDFVPNPPPYAPNSEVYVVTDALPPAPDSFKFWVRVEFLTLWVKNSPAPVSVVTGDPNNPTQELLNSDRSFGAFSGVRIGFGFWLDRNNTAGLEGSFFSLERRSRRFFASSDDSGNPALSFNFTNQTPGAAGADQMPITFPGQFTGDVRVTSTLELWGAEVNGALVLMQRRGGFEFTALAGFRYLDLRERLNITTFTSDITTDPNTVLFQSDQFSTRNQFYGGQIGGRLDWRGERFGLDLTAKLALGATHQEVEIEGFSSQTGPGVNGTFPGGFFTQPSNIGHYSANQFTVVPSVELKFYLFVTAQLRAFIGYDFMYWNQVVRPGSQVDRNLNLSQSAIYGNGALIGPAYPMPLFNRTDFWAQGITFGLDFRF